MAIQDFTKYLGAQVKFTYKPYPRCVDLAHLVDTVEGVIEEVLLTQDLQDSQFLVDSEYYPFKSVDFIDVLLVSG